MESKGITMELQRQPEHRSGGGKSQRRSGEASSPFLMGCSLCWVHLYPELQTAEQQRFGTAGRSLSVCRARSIMAGWSLFVCRARSIGSSFGNSPAGAVQSQGCALPFAKLCRREENKSVPVVWKEGNWIYRQSMALSASAYLWKVPVIFFA